MKTNIIQQEILLVTGAAFASGQLCKIDFGYIRPKDQLSSNEQLEEACWNGLLQFLLPGLCLQKADGGDLYLWEIRETESFLKLDLGEVPGAVDNRSSINPHSFLSMQSFN